MKFFFVNSADSELAAPNAPMLTRVRAALLNVEGILEVNHPAEADVVLIQEANSYKDFRYIEKMLSDPVVSVYANKVFTINDDDCATGLLRGLYTCIPRKRFQPHLHACVPYMCYPNELVFSKASEVAPFFLAGWRGNAKSNKIRPILLHSLASFNDCQVEATSSWMNHSLQEKEAYVHLVQNCKFSLCPAGWAAVSYRIYESMALGRCPVIIADDFVAPTGPDWERFAFFFPERQIENIHAFLLSHESRYHVLGQNARLAWEQFFGPENIGIYFAKALLRIISSNISVSRESEIKRWRSLHQYWVNNWTIPQRALNKVRKMIAQ